MFRVVSIVLVSLNYILETFGGGDRSDIKVEEVFMHPSWANRPGGVYPSLGQTLLA